VRQGQRTPKFKIVKKKPKKKKIKMIKLKNSNVMHFDPNYDLIKSFREEKELEKVGEKNPLKESGVEEDIDGDTCGICYKNQVNAVFLDCNHCEVCMKCAYRSTKINGLCPFCRNVSSKFHDPS
jgi:hypothetical protein